MCRTVLTAAPRPVLAVRGVALLVVLAVWVLLALSAPTDAAAQGFGSWISPGPLTWDHQDLDTVTGCPSCHAPGRGPAPDRCNKCHETVRTQVATRSGFHADLGTGCERCHAEHRGRDHVLIPDLARDPTFDHAKQAGWPLEGKHAPPRTGCIDCHAEPGVYKGLDKECSTCHDDPHGKDESNRDLLQNCEDCHDAEDWDALPLPTAVFDHNNRDDADYALVGLHNDVECAGCHVDARFVPLDYELCTDCHVNPHRAPFKERPCEDCHPTPATWVVKAFDHDLTRYDLVGQHVGVACEDCHQGDKTEPIAFNACETCHLDLHKGQFRPQGCEDCHTVQVAAFALRDWDHDQTDWPLVGKHVEQECEECHDDQARAVYRGLAHEDCDACHDDAHSGRFEPTDCQKCHVPDGFEVNAFDHDQTDFPHTGKHVGLECNQCHRDYQWNGIPHESCLDCHYTKNPHSGTVTSDQCEGCHTTEAFDVMQFDHAEETGFDLAPAHDELACRSCHEQVEDFEGLDSSCTACHQDDLPWGHYTGPCETCHTAEHWAPAGLGDNDHAVTGFALRGAHSLEPCEACHPVGEPRGMAESDCESCHTRDDPHMNLLGTACADCHTEMSWLRTSWRHTTTGWPLRGTHRLAACVDCHATGYVGTPTECFRCHEADAVTRCGSPRCVSAHSGPSFAECDSCHVVYAWDVGTERYPH